MTKRIDFANLFENFEIKFDPKSILVDTKDNRWHYNNETITTSEKEPLGSMAVVAEWQEGRLLSFPDFTMRVSLTSISDPDRVVIATLPFSSAVYEKGTYETNAEAEYAYYAWEWGLQLWQFVYNTVKKTPAAAECAFLYRKYNNVCHACYGEGIDPNVTPESTTLCYICNGSGYFEHVKK
jgi:hypothetical protein